MLRLIAERLRALALRLRGAEVGAKCLAGRRLDVRNTRGIRLESAVLDRRYK